MIKKPHLKTEENEDLKNFLLNLKLFNKIRFFVWFGFGFVFLILGLIKIYYNPPEVILLLFIMGIFTYFFDFLIRIKETRGDLGKIPVFYFFFQILEIIVALILIHVSGTTPILGAFVLVNYLFSTYFTYYERKYRIAILIYCIIAYSLLLFLEYLDIFPLKDALNLGININKNFPLFMVGFVPNVLLMILLFIIITIFSERLQKSIKELFKKEQELKKSKTALETEVKSRTKELEEEKNSLEKKISDRTKELRDKINEMEKFQKLSVGRELKMVELKKELELLKRKNRNDLRGG